MHSNSQSTYNKPDNQRQLSFLNLKVNVDSRIKFACCFHQKPTDTDKIMNFRNCVSLKNKRKVYEGTVHRVLRWTSIWEKCNELLGANQKQLLDNQFWGDKVRWESYTIIT